MLSTFYLPDSTAETLHSQ